VHAGARLAGRSAGLKALLLCSTPIATTLGRGALSSNLRFDFGRSRRPPVRDRSGRRRYPHLPGQLGWPIPCLKPDPSWRPKPPPLSARAGSGGARCSWLSSALAGERHEGLTVCLVKRVRRWRRASGGSTTLDLKPARYLALNVNLRSQRIWVRHAPCGLIDRR